MIAQREMRTIENPGENQKKSQKRKNGIQEPVRNEEMENRLSDIHKSCFPVFVMP
jgi:hypothetical protein